MHRLPLRSGPSPRVQRASEGPNSQISTTQTQLTSTPLQPKLRAPVYYPTSDETQSPSQYMRTTPRDRYGETPRSSAPPQGALIMQCNAMQCSEWRTPGGNPQTPLRLGFCAPSSGRHLEKRSKSQSIVCEKNVASHQSLIRGPPPGSFEALVVVSVQGLH